MDKQIIEHVDKIAIKIQWIIKRIVLVSKSRKEVKKINANCIKKKPKGVEANIYQPDDKPPTTWNVKLTSNSYQSIFNYTFPLS